MALTLVTGPEQEPISLEEVKMHLRIDASDDDFMLQTLIIAARQWAENETHRLLVTQTWDWTLDQFPQQCPLLITDTFYGPTSLMTADQSLVGAVAARQEWTDRVPLAPVQSVSITYLDSNDAQQTLSSSVYQLDAKTEPGRLVLVSGQSWPTLSLLKNCVTVRIVAGYGLAAKIPRTIKLAMLLHVEAHYDRDKDMMPLLIEAGKNLLFPSKLLRA